MSEHMLLRRADSERPFDRIMESAKKHINPLLAMTIESVWSIAVESPIEKLMAGALSVACSLRLGSFHLGKPKDRGDPRACLTSQVEIGLYRVDFVLSMLNAEIVIECDGHDFHEKTKEQAQKDKARDRELQLRGYQVHRFTGAEIWADPVNCAMQACEALESYYIDLNAPKA